MNEIQTCTHCTTRWWACTIMPVSSFRFVHNWGGNCLFFSDVVEEKYSPAEDNALLAFVEANKHHSPVTGNKLWRLAEVQGVTPHTWQSMKSRWELILGEAKKKAKKKTKKKKKEAKTQRRPGFSPSTFHLHHRHADTVHLNFDITSTSHTTATSTSTTTYTGWRHTDGRHWDGGHRGRHPPVFPCSSLLAGGCLHPNTASTVPSTFKIHLDY